MKRIMLIVCMVALVTAISQAQDIPDHEAGRHHKMKRHLRSEVFKNLNLTDEQKGKFKELNDDHRKQMAELKKNDQITMKESRNKMETLKKEHREKIQSLLTPEQKTQLEKSKQEQRAKMQERSKTRFERMKQTLNLTDEQSAKLKTNREAMQQKIKSIREDKALNDESRKGKVKELMKQQKESMRSILTEDQLKKLDEMKQKRGARKKIL